MEFGHFILVIVKLDCRVANDGNVRCASPTRVILHSVSLKCISLSGILHYEYRWGKKKKKEKEVGGAEFNLCMHSFEQQVNGKAVKQYEFLPFVAGDCNFEKPLAACGYSQGRDDDLDWEQANTREKPSSDPWMPSGEDGDTGE